MARERAAGRYHLVDALAGADKLQPHEVVELLLPVGASGGWLVLNMWSAIWDDAGDLYRAHKHAVVDIPAERGVPSHEAVEMAASPRQVAQVGRLHKAEDVVEDFHWELREMYHRPCRYR